MIICENGLFQKINCNPLLRIPMENSRGVEQNLLEFQEVHQKLRKKRGFPGGGVNAKKNGKFQGDHGKFDWKFRG